MATGLERIAEKDSVNPRLKSSVREIRTLGSVGVGLLEVSSPSTRRRGLVTRPYSM